MRSSTHSWPSRRVAIAASLLVLATAGCAAGGAPAGVSVSGAWVRAPAGSDLPAAAYLTIKGGEEADALLGVTSPAAATAEVHQTMTDSSGMTGMHPINRLEIPAGETVSLEVGGHHVMLTGVAAGAIEVGKTVELRLTFEKAGEIVVQAEVRAG